MKTTLNSNTIIEDLQKIIAEHGPVTIEKIYPPGTPVDDVSLFHSQKKINHYIIKISYGE